MRQVSILFMELARSLILLVPHSISIPEFSSRHKAGPDGRFQGIFDKVNLMMLCQSQNGPDLDHCNLFGRYGN